MKSTKILKIIAVVSGILTVLHIGYRLLHYYFLLYVLGQIANPPPNTSVAIDTGIGIIGSSDGPTYIYTSVGNTNHILMEIFFIVCVFINIISVILLLKKKK